MIQKPKEARTTKTKNNMKNNMKNVVKGKLGLGDFTKRVQFNCLSLALGYPNIRAIDQDCVAKIRSKGRD